MNPKKSCMVKLSRLLLPILLLSIVPGVKVKSEIIDFESDRWVLKDALVTEYLGRKSLRGYAFLKDVEFENGIIEVDMAVSGSRSYPGIIFRMQSVEDCERFYIRPHRANLYPDALQYTPVFNGIDCWQLYNGDGLTAGADIPVNRWFHLKMEISGKQARIYLNDSDQPALAIYDLKHGLSKGTIGVLGPNNTSAYFSNFSYKIDSTLQFESPPPVETPPGMITEWELSQNFKISQIDMEKFPDDQILSGLQWKKATSEPSGLVNISRYVRRNGSEPDCIFARTIINAKKPEVEKLLFGYSDVISIFLNGKILFSGTSSYQKRDPSFLGIIGLFDRVYLPLEEGKNELFLIIAESFGGWGFMCQDGSAIFQHESVEKKWETENKFKMPESIVYDSARGMLYVSNYGSYDATNQRGEYISRVSLDGVIEELKWVADLNNPTGMAILNNKLFVVERKNLVEIDIQSGRIAKRYPVPQARFLNDITVDLSDNLYISDSYRNLIYRFKDGSFEEWLSGLEIKNPDGLYIHKNKLILCSTGDNRLKQVDLDTKEISTITNLSSGIPDGIKTDVDGNYLLSHWEGRIYKINPSGEIKKLLDLSAPEINCADFEYIPGKGLLLIPTYFDNRIMCYEINQQFKEKR
ncbi:MAG: SMP-30/gluconolactonase/LRE family protein [candidate division Zixibacteria bacterium]|nr:SMP-30/gluconolactonase/LRE family protein [candidate division Zixibacteria bacterium]